MKETWWAYQEQQMLGAVLKQNFHSFIIHLSIHLSINTYLSINITYLLIVSISASLFSYSNMYA